MIKRIVPFLLFLLCSFCGVAQELVFSNLGNELQLPSQECYKIHQDKQGYIWFSTDNGLCRYANGSLKIFDRQNGLPEESVYNISEDASGRVWFATSDNRIVYFDGQQLVEAAFSKQYNKPAVNKWAHPIPMMLDMSDPENSLIANSYYTCKVNRITNAVSIIPRTSTEAALQVIKMKGHALLPNRLLVISTNFMITHVKTETKEKTIITRDLLAGDAVKWNIPTVFSGDIDFIGKQNCLLKLNADLSYSTLYFPGHILNLYIDKTKGLWVGVQNNGVYYYPDVNTMKLAHHSLNGFSVTGICEDTEGGVWCSTLEKGIFYCRNKYLISYSAVPGLNKQLSLLTYAEGNVFASSCGSLFECTDQGYRMYPLSFGNTIFSDILYQKDHWLLTGDDIIL